ncbi:MAG: septum formation initiator family protein [Candidatus Levybacteria bacterium]|nr:septum formation initiator family protein [Candidatus Levybacteria bacterium]MBI4100761.1 septum formation initiator family protein [Candidatus Microgenomates bacterium]
MKNRLLTGIILLVGLYLISSLTKSTYSLWQKTEMVKEAERKRVAQEQRGEELKKQLEFSQTPEFVEKEAREKLNLGKPGETMIILPPFESTTSASEVALPNWKKWLRLFF